VLAVVIGTILKAVQLLRDNVDGLRTYVMDAFDTLISRFMVIADMFDTTFGEGSALGDFFHKFVFGVVMIFSDVLDAQVHTLQTIIAMLAEVANNPWQAFKEGPIALFMRKWRETEQQTQEKTRQRGIQHALDVAAYRKRKADESTKDRETAPNYDFRGSRFDITQKFSEGFDPDRIALAFSSDLAALGERKLQSGFVPAGALR